MRELIASSLIMILVLGGWLVFLHYADLQSQNMTSEIHQSLLPLIEAEDWQAVEIKLQNLNQDWHEFRKFALYFLHTDTINDIDYSIARSMEYAKAHDASNTGGELNAAAEQLSFLTENQKLTLKNIF